MNDASVVDMVAVAVPRLFAIFLIVEWFRVGVVCRVGEWGLVLPSLRLLRLAFAMRRRTHSTPTNGGLDKLNIRHSHPTPIA